MTRTSIPLQTRVAASKRAAKSRGYRAAVTNALAKDTGPAATFARVTFSTLPPSANGLFANTDSGRAKAEAYTAWRNQVVADLRFIQRAPLVAGRIHIDWRFQRPRTALSDISNRVKAAEDALVKAGVITNDRLVESFTARWDDEISGTVAEVKVIA